MASFPDRRGTSPTGPSRGSAGHHFREPGRRLRLVAIASIGLLVATAVVVGFAGTPAQAVTPVDGCTVVAHPNATRFTDCPGANLSGANLSGVDLAYADLASANLSGANLTSTELKHADLAGAVLSQCTFLMPPTGDFTCQIANVSGADLRFVNGSTANLSGVDFSGDNLEGSNLSSATLVSFCVPPTIREPACATANFTSAKLSQVNLAHAITSSCLTIEVEGFGPASFCGGVTITGANAKDLNVAGDDLSWVDLSNDNLTGATFTAATFSECEPSIAASPQCSGVDLDGSKLRGIDLSGQRMEGIELKDAQLTGANLSNADLGPLPLPVFGEIPTDLTGANLGKADMQGANLSDASLPDTKLGGTNLAAATLNGVTSGGITGKPSALPPGWALVKGFLVQTGS
jgi:uncharacterized protein YjbI with pentapeptide repeats